MEFFLYIFENIYLLFIPIVLIILIHRNSKYVNMSIFIWILFLVLSFIDFLYLNYFYNNDILTDMFYVLSIFLPQVFLSPVLLPQIFYSWLLCLSPILFFKKYVKNKYINFLYVNFYFVILFILTFKVCDYIIDKYEDARVLFFILSLPFYILVYCFYLIYFNILDRKNNSIKK